MSDASGHVLSVPPQEERAGLLWKQYQLHVDLYKFYLDLVLKASTFSYGITGAIVSYYLAHLDESRIRLALGLPLLMNVALAGIYIYGAVLMRPVRNEMFRIRDDLGLENAPDFVVLMVMLGAFGTFSLVVSVSLGALILGY